jgi:translation initiation factor 2 subunit 2
MTDVIDFSTLKKPTKKGAAQTKKDAPIEDSDSQYEVMLNRIFESLKKNKGGVSEKQQKCIIKQPEVVREGTKKTCWVNFQDICDNLGRPADHLSKFILMELGTDGSIARETQMILKGRYLEKQIESLLRKYITEYVMCQMCKKIDTVLTKDSTIRMFTMTCKKCGCTRSVQPIKEGYHHVSKAERTKARND